MPDLHLTPQPFAETPPAADPGAGDGWVTRRGKIFEVGAYPDKHFALTEAEADAALAAFPGAEIELEHFATEGRRSILDGALGRVQSVVRQGRDLIGTVQVPAWLDTLWGRYGRKISAVWTDRDADGRPVPKRLVRAGLVLEPRIDDAALFAAAFAGARDSRETRSHMQQIHDLAVTHGAQCAGAPATYSQEVPMPGFMDDLMALFGRHNIPVAESGGGAPQTPSGSPGPSAPPPSTPPSAPTPPPSPPSPPSAGVFNGAHPAAAVDPQIAQMQAEIAALRATQAQQIADARRAQAAAQVESLVTGGYLMPAARAFSVDMLTQALADDAATPHTFAGPNDTNLSRAGMLIEGWRARGPHGLTGEAVILFGAPEGPADADADDLKAADEAIAAYTAKRAQAPPKKEAT